MPPIQPDLQMCYNSYAPSTNLLRDLWSNFMSISIFSLLIAGIFTLTLGIIHFFFPALLDFKQAIPRQGAPIRPFRLGPIHYATQRSDVHGIAWVMNHAASYTLVSIGLLDLFAYSLDRPDIRPGTQFLDRWLVVLTCRQPTLPRPATCRLAHIGRICRVGSATRGGGPTVIEDVRTQIDHRPWPLPAGPWQMRQSWHDLLFAHWPVEA